MQTERTDHVVWSSANPGASSKPEGTPFAYHLARLVFGSMTAVLTKSDWRGVEHLPKRGGFIVCANHLSYLDPFAVAQYLHENGHPAYFLTKASLFKVPIIGPWMRAGGQVPVYRETARAGESLRAAVQALAKGRCIVVMPESTLGRDPELWPMVGKTGAARLALKTRRPVIPLAQWGAQELMPPYGWPQPLPIKTMRLIAGPPVPLEDLHQRPMDEPTLREATERIMAAITAGLEELRGEKAPALRWDRAQGRRVDPLSPHQPVQAADAEVSAT